jgi:hypothetical protein
VNNPHSLQEVEDGVERKIANLSRQAVGVYFPQFPEMAYHMKLNIQHKVLMAINLRLHLNHFVIL